MACGEVLAEERKDAKAMTNAAAQQLGRLGGLARSAAKARAARENGKLGGRPRSAGQPDAEARKRAWETRRNAMKTIVAILLLATTASAADLTLTRSQAVAQGKEKTTRTARLIMPAPDAKVRDTLSLPAGHTAPRATAQGWCGVDADS